jgi:hypothetical protein
MALLSCFAHATVMGLSRRQFKPLARKHDLHDSKNHTKSETLGKDN